MPEHFGIPVNTLDLLDRLDTDDEAIAADLSDLVRGSIATGERRDELLGADWPDFDGHAKELQVNSSLIRRARGAIKNDGKTTNAERGIPLPDWYVVMLVDRRDRLRAPNPTGPITCNSRSGYLSFQNLTNRQWLPFRRRAGCEWVAFKTLRKRSPPCSTTPGSPPARSPLGLGVRRSR